MLCVHALGHSAMTAEWENPEAETPDCPVLGFKGSLARVLPQSSGLVRKPYLRDLSQTLSFLTVTQLTPHEAGAPPTSACRHM